MEFGQIHEWRFSDLLRRDEAPISRATGTSPKAKDRRAWLSGSPSGNAGRSSSTCESPFFCGDISQGQAGTIPERRAFDRRKHATRCRVHSGGRRFRCNSEYPCKGKN